MKLLDFKKVVKDEFEHATFHKVAPGATPTLTVKRSFFYHHGMSAEKWASNAQAKLEAMGSTVRLCEAREDWRAWPSTSYFVAQFEVVSLPA